MGKHTQLRQKKRRNGGKNGRKKFKDIRFRKDLF